MKTFKEYQDFVLNTTIMYPSAGNNLVYPALGLVGESGEYADKVKKYWRNRGVMDASLLTTQERMEFVKELGDVLWYVIASADELDVDLETVIAENVLKLTDRRARGVVKGEGDNR